jgi:hypothetical protein
MKHQSLRNIANFMNAPTFLHYFEFLNSTIINFSGKSNLTSPFDTF